MVDSVESTTGPVAPADPQATGVHEEFIPVAADFNKQKLIQSFPKHKTNKLDKSNYVQWQ